MKLFKASRFVVLLVGILLGITSHLLIDLFPLVPGDAIDIVAILVNIIIGVAIVFIIQKRLSDDRGVKDYFINEVSEIKHEYIKFVNSVLQSKVDSKFILEWFKTISIRIDQVEHFLKYRLEMESTSLAKLNREIHILVTNSADFNNSFQKTAFSPNNTMRNEISDRFKNLKYAFISTIIGINQA